jgi:Na+/proline symporter
MIVGILMGSGVKGMLVGVLSGLFARKVNSNAAGIAVGAGVGLLFAWLVAMNPEPDGSHYYVQIMVPGFITGAIIGFLTQRMGTAPKGSTYAKTSSL